MIIFPLQYGYKTRDGTKMYELESGDGLYKATPGGVFLQNVVMSFNLVENVTKIVVLHFYHSHSNYNHTLLPTAPHSPHSPGPAEEAERSTSKSGSRA